MLPYRYCRASVVALIVAISLAVLPENGAASNLADSKGVTLQVGSFSDGIIEGWEHKSFAGETNYTFVTITLPGLQHKVLKASSDNTASGLFRKMKINLEKTPWMHWSWKTEQLFSNINENEKDGDDFVARIYIVIDGGIFFWNTRALNYVWSSSHQTGETWPNPFTSHATMIAVESGSENLGKWRFYKRNIRKDLQKIVGRDVRYIDAVAIMTDSDNTGQKATTYFGDIFFTSE